MRACLVRGERLRIGFSIAGRSRVAERVWTAEEAAACEEDPEAVPGVKGWELSAGRDTRTIGTQYTIQIKNMLRGDPLSEFPPQMPTGSSIPGSILEPKWLRNIHMYIYTYIQTST